MIQVIFLCILDITIHEFLSNEESVKSPDPTWYCMTNIKG